MKSLLPRRRILCVFPRYEPSFGTFEYAYPLTAGVRAFMPPQGLLVIAASLPEGWEVRFIDENLRRATPEEMRWADAIFVSGMHVQRLQIHDICRRAHEQNRIAVLGGSSASSTPNEYADFDYVHVGELGDATEALFETLGERCVRPARQIVFTTRERRPLEQFPIPAYQLTEIRRYLLASIQFSSGCPFRCEFCDIPALYGRNPRMKTVGQITAELDRLRALGHEGAVYFVDDNFFGNHKAVRDLLPVLSDWQKRHGYPFTFACEATLNLARSEEILRQMREAFFTTVFCGIETPDPEAMRSISKQQNTAIPLLEAVQQLNAHGLEVVAGIILGLDSDTPDAGDRVLEFIERSRIPMLTINLLQALPHTPLWDRLQREGRLVEDPTRETNVRYLMPHDEVVRMWRSCVQRAYHPKPLLERFQHQLEATYPNRIRPPRDRAPTLGQLRKAGEMLGRIFWRLGVRGDYRRDFWRFVAPLLKNKDLPHLIQVSLTAHHLITFAREAAAGEQNASFYSRKLRRQVPATPEAELPARV